jgi:hypothetical protein
MLQRGKIKRNNLLDLFSKTTGINLTENHHILVSAGRDFDGPNLFTAYLGYQYTFGPKEQKTSMLLQPKK